MFSANLDAREFSKDLSNIIDYSIGFLEGAQRGKNTFMKNLGSGITEILNQYLDANARVTPQLLQHVYEWEKSGSPDARLFDINYVVTGTGLSMGATFRQSSSVQAGSTTPFYDKARIMEQGIPVTIRPKTSGILAFKDGDEEVFTRKPVFIQDPGGPMAEGGFEKTFRSFFDNYFTQAFMQSSGIAKYLQDPSVFSKNFASAKRGGRALGITTGFRWITSARIEAA